MYKFINLFNRIFIKYQTSLQLYILLSHTYLFTRMSKIMYSSHIFPTEAKQ